MDIGLSWIAPVVIGVIIGWLIEWVIDWLYWRRRGVPSVVHDALQAQVRELESTLASATRQLDRRQTELSAAQMTIEGLRSEHARLVQTHQKALSDLDASTAQAATHAADLAALRAVGTTERRDPLVDINGIGPVYQERLYAAGITTFAMLLEQGPDRLRELVEAKEWQDIDAEAWIAEARTFAQQVLSGTYRKGRG